MNAQLPITPAVRFVPRQLTLSEREDAFRGECAERYDALRCYADGDVMVLDQIAQVLADAMRKVEPLVAKLDMAIDRHDANGFSKSVESWKAANVDEAALVEALFWDRLTGAAEALLKAQVAQAVSQ